LNDPRTYAPTHRLTHSPTHPLTHSPTHPLTHLLTHSSTHAPTHTHTRTHSQTRAAALLAYSCLDTLRRRLATLQLGLCEERECDLCRSFPLYRSSDKLLRTLGLLSSRLLAAPHSAPLPSSAHAFRYAIRPGIGISFFKYIAQSLPHIISHSGPTASPP